MNISVRKPLFCLSLAFLFIVWFSIGTQAQEPTKLRSINYRLSMPRPQSHLFEVAIEVDLDANSKEGVALEFQMPKWSPGRYAVFDFAKNVRSTVPRQVAFASRDAVA